MMKKMMTKTPENVQIIQQMLEQVQQSGLIQKAVEEEVHKQFMKIQKKLQSEKATDWTANRREVHELIQLLRKEMEKFQMKESFQEYLEDLNQARTIRVLMES
ncbi:hypothetical protein R1flu_013534 [Riccia fluitans]|uniref:Uncharacterized protein n=1 Tax=Riccia fluitans TaxID=41844 RepID=A0ABD1YDK2_9MARC